MDICCQIVFQDEFFWDDSVLDLHIFWSVQWHAKVGSKQANTSIHWLGWMSWKWMGQKDLCLWPASLLDHPALFLLLDTDVWVHWHTKCPTHLCILDVALVVSVQGVIMSPHLKLGMQHCWYRCYHPLYLPHPHPFCCVLQGLQKGGTTLISVSCMSVGCRCHCGWCRWHPWSCHRHPLT